MPDVSVIGALITTAGTLAGALGGIVLTSWTGIRREERQTRRLREDAQKSTLQEAYADLLGESAQMRVHIEITCQRHWNDLDVRLTRAQDHAVTIGLLAYRAALLSPGDTANAALELGNAARKLSAWTAINADLVHSTSSDNQFSGGVVVGRPDFAEMDGAAAEFLRLASAALGKNTAGGLHVTSHTEVSGSTRKRSITH
jgi:hypothetical protein